MYFLFPKLIIIHSDSVILHRKGKYACLSYTIIYCMDKTQATQKEAMQYRKQGAC